MRSTVRLAHPVAAAELCIQDAAQSEARSCVAPELTASLERRASQDAAEQPGRTRPQWLESRGQLEEEAQPRQAELAELDAVAVPPVESQQEQVFRSSTAGVLAAAEQQVFPLLAARQPVEWEQVELPLVSPGQRQLVVLRQPAALRVALGAALPEAVAVAADALRLLFAV